jgi:hypothetical protein
VLSVIFCFYQKGIDDSEKADSEASRERRLESLPFFNEPRPDHDVGFGLLGSLDEKGYLAELC